VSQEPAPAASRVIKRYENRKLYDPQARRYVTLEDLAGMVAAGTEVHVLDQRSGEDLTAVVLAQVILEGIKQRTANIPRQVLSRLIRLGARTGARAAEWIGPAEAAARARQEAERIVAGLLGRGRLSLEEALALRQEISGSVQRIVSEAQRGLEARIRGLMDTTARDAGLTPAIHGLKERLLSFETYLAEPKTKARSQAGAAADGRARPRPGRAKGEERWQAGRRRRAGNRRRAATSGGTPGARRSRR
jgi:polyhydroxyalkanoate synthesis repressor PhaR